MTDKRSMNEQDVINKATLAVEEHMLAYSTYERCQKIMSRIDDILLIPADVRNEFKKAEEKLSFGIFPKMHEMMTLMDLLLVIIDNRAKDNLHSDRN